MRHDLGYASGRSLRELSELTDQSFSAVRNIVDRRVDVSTGMTRDQVRSLLLAHAVAGRVATDPDGTRALARDNLRRMQASSAGGAGTVWLDAWEPLLDRPLLELLAALTSPSPWSRDLRQTSLFAGVLTPAERPRVLAVRPSAAVPMRCPWMSRGRAG